MIQNSNTEMFRSVRSKDFNYNSLNLASSYNRSSANADAKDLS